MRWRNFTWTGLALTALVPHSVVGQALHRTPQAVEARVRFDGATRLGTAKDSARVDIRLWNVAGGQKIKQLALPFAGTLIVELRAGSLTTVIGGKRQSRREGEFWTVPAGTPMGLETQDDVATFQTTLVASPLGAR